MGCSRAGARSVGLHSHIDAPSCCSMQVTCRVTRVGAASASVVLRATGTGNTDIVKVRVGLGPHASCSI